MAAYSQVKRKAEDGFEAIITNLQGAALSGVPIYKGMDVEELTGTRIEILCERALPEVLSDTITGNYRCEVEIRLVAHYKDKTRAQRTAMEDELFDICMRDDIADQINNAGILDFWVYGGGGPGAGESWEPEAVESGVLGTGVRAESISGVLYCRPALAT